MASKKVAVRVNHLSKRYQLGGPQEAYKTFRDALINSIKAPLNVFHTRSTKNDFWALKDVSFEVDQSEVVGIIGRNGAGKSTMLKILSRITMPTEGNVELHGRVGSLLEVGTGFHPELTGRENIYLSGSILGMKRKEIDAKFDEIVRFSEIEKFLDTPVKRYSSGMYVRLAFAVAAHLEPEILLVDEVLAVGDATFQKKCIGKMGEVAKEGRTVLFISHQMNAIRSLCNRTILLDKGQIIYNGPTEQALFHYSNSYADDLQIKIDTLQIRRPSNITNLSLRISSISIVTSGDQAIITINQPLIFYIHFIVMKKLQNVVFGWSVHSMDNIRIFECRSIDTIKTINIEPGEYTIRTEISNHFLNPGYYNLHIGARFSEGGLDYLPGVMTFQVTLEDKMDSLWLEERSGLLSFNAKWVVDRL